MKKMMHILLVGLFSVMITVACQQDTGGSAAEESGEGLPPEPVTLKVVNHVIDGQEWEHIITEPIQEKYPHVTLEMTTSGDISELIAANEVPDLILTPLVNTQNLLNLEVLEPLDEYISKYDSDLTVIEPVVLDAIEKYYPEGIIGLPLYTNVGVLMYNKELFNKFGIDYPANHSTYEDILTIAQRMTRTESGTDYIGYQPDHWFNMNGQQSKSFINNETNQADLSGLEEAFPIHKAAYDLSEGIMEASFYDGTVAMAHTYIADINLDAMEGIDFGIATMPEFDFRPGFHTEVDAHAIFVTSTSEHKDLAYQVMSHISLSEENQTVMSRSGRITHLTNEEILNQYGVDAGLNHDEILNVLSETNPAPHREIHPLDRRGEIVIEPINEVYEEYVTGELDLNTALRMAEEKVNQRIEDVLMKE